MSEEFVYTTKTPISFGKYKGRKLKKIMEEDPDYVDWCIKNVEWFKLSKNATKWFGIIKKDTQKENGQAPKPSIYKFNRARRELREEKYYSNSWEDCPMASNGISPEDLGISNGW